ncbi:hypothetical protein BV924_02340 [Pectobacterium odoriferum]|uniref:Uncharacterized protein n=1 Tax=Pectobacterium odoriferum TaxID=78398 RepID=A0ABD6VV16_9GAMM|nr:hypothetical protein BVY06_05910 [Pectobacterium odoriferum]POE15635.1 hypothetical protein BV924_02340 [Pectobacterium odoriferum]POE29173.1 hypothetical protein BV926_02335 [Pectobacterium odoriferum]POE34522.1 hypothetical protein BV919_02335 [Pectobacterium odoriferum]POE40747.1 hypothetical protein BV920_06105 [Pectobacterium odoriferum]
MLQCYVIQKVRLYSSYFKLHVRWLHLGTRITYLSKLIGMPSLAALFGLMASPLRGQRKRCSKR